MFEKIHLHNFKHSTHLLKYISFFIFFFCKHSSAVNKKTFIQTTNIVCMHFNLIWISKFTWLKTQTSPSFSFQNNCIKLKHVLEAAPLYSKQTNRITRTISLSPELRLSGEPSSDASCESAAVRLKLIISQSLWPRLLVTSEVTADFMQAHVRLSLWLKGPVHRLYTWSSCYCQLTAAVCCDSILAVEKTISPRGPFSSYSGAFDHITQSSTDWVCTVVMNKR